MATLFAITYPESSVAKMAMDSIDWSDVDHLIDVKAACWITKKDDELQVHTRGGHNAGRAALGGTLGLLVGGLLAIPVVGIAAGVTAGVMSGRNKTVEVDEAFVQSIGDQLKSGGSALIVLYEDEADTRKAAYDLALYGGKVQSTDLSPDQLRRFQAALDKAK